MICMKCLAISSQDARFCNKCGKPFVAQKVISQAKKLNAASVWGKSGNAVPSGPETAKEPEHLLPWIAAGIKKAVREIPKHIASLAIYAGVVLLINLIFWTVNIYQMPGWLLPLKGVISTVVFLTATYNDIIPKTVFWVIVFTFGKKLLKSMRKKGFAASFACMKKIIPEFAAALSRVSAKAYPILLSGIGIGLVIANNFASYSRFSQARNKMDKYFIVIVMAFTISYLLGEAKKTGLFRFVKFTANDVSRLFGKAALLDDDGVYIFLSGFIAGLLLDAPLILAKWLYGGYIMGAVALIAGIALYFIAGRHKR